MRARLLPLLVVAAFTVGLGVVIWNSTKPVPLPTEPLAAAKKNDAPAPSAAPEVEPATAPSPVAPTRVSDAAAKSGKHWWDGFVPGKKARVGREVAATEETTTIAIEGVVVVKDSDGREHLEESGTFLPAFYEPRSPRDSDGEIPPGLADAFAEGGFGRAWREGEPVAVEGGRFNVEVPAGREFGAQKLKLGGRSAVTEGGPSKVAAGERVTIRAHWVDGVRVRVLDRATHAELDDVTVARANEHLFGPMGDGDPGDPALLETVVEHAHSPVVVPAKELPYGPELNADVWIRARGHAWHGVRIDYKDVSERTVELVGAATLVVEVRGELPEPLPSTDASTNASTNASDDDVHDENPARLPRGMNERVPMLRLRRPTEQKKFDDVVKEALDHYDRAKPSDFPGGRKPPLAEFQRTIESMRDQYEARHSVHELVSERPATIGETRFESLAAQSLVVSIELGQAYRSPLVVASSAVTTAAGETMRIELEAKKVGLKTAVPFAGTIFVPSGWNVGALGLGFEAVDLAGVSDTDARTVPSHEWKPLSGRTGWYRWDAGACRPAKYMIKVDGTGIVKPAVLAPAGDSNVEIVLPEAGTLRVRLVDASDGRAVEMAGLCWQPERTDVMYYGFAMVPLEYSSWLKRYSGHVPVGRGALFSLMDENWSLDPESSAAEIHSGEQELVARVHRSCGMTVELVCDGAKIPWNQRDAFEIKIVSVDGANRMIRMSLGDSLPLISVGEPGRYTVTLPALDGYEPVAPFEIDIAAGAFVKKTVELKKKR